jgi:hypothetical protein
MKQSAIRSQALRLLEDYGDLVYTISRRYADSPEDVEDTAI